MIGRKLAWTMVVLLAIISLALWLGPRAVAFKDGVLAYLYGYPLITADITRAMMTKTDDPPRPGAVPVNQFTHVQKFPDASFVDVVAPNADTLYSIAWLDLAAEPMVLHLPEMGKRWVLMQLLDAWSNAFASPGTRRNGSAARDYAIVGPGWQGTLPAGLERIDSPTNSVWLLGRTYTAGPDDYAAVHALQAQYRLMPLSAFLGKPSPPHPAQSPGPAIDVNAPVVTQVARLDAQQYFNRLAQLMVANPPAVADAPIVTTLADLGIVAGQPFDFAALSAAKRQGLSDAVWFVRAMFESRAKGSQADLSLRPWQSWFFAELTRLTDKYLAKTYNGWSMPLNLGAYGTNYPLRATVALIGFGANTAVDAVYPSTILDGANMRLNGANRYVLHFAKDQIPPVDDFWSLTMYNDKMFFVANPINRYTLGDRDRFALNADGSLDLFIQHDDPGPARHSNWLPAPTGDFKLMLRLYGPKAQVLDGRWTPPAVQRVD